MFTHFRSSAIPCKKNNIICQFAMCLPGTHAPFHNEQYLDWREEPVDCSHLKGIACYTQLNSSRLSANKLISEQIRSSNKYTNSLEISWNLTFGALTPSWKERSEKRPAVWVWEDCALPCKTSDQGLPCWRTHIYFSTWLKQRASLPSRLKKHYSMRHVGINGDWFSFQTLNQEERTRK